MAISYSESLALISAGAYVPNTGVWVRFVSNNTGTAYVSDGATDNKGGFTYTTKPPGDVYAVSTGPTNTGPWTLFRSNWNVPVVAGETPALSSVTTLASGPYVPSAVAGGEDFAAAVRIIGGKPWVDATHPTYGATGNALTVSDGVMNGSTGVLTSVSGKFTVGDVGKSIFVIGAGAAGVPLRTTIASYQSATQVTLTASSSTAVGAALTVWGLNNAAAINSAITAANALSPGAVVYLPVGTYLIDTPAILLKSNVALQGAGPGLTVLVGAISGANGLVGTTQSGSTKTVYSNIGVYALSINSYNGHASSFYNISSLVVNNCEFYFSAGPTLIECLFIEHCQHVAVAGNYLHDFNGNGIQINSTDHFRVSDNLILGSTNADDLIDIDRDFLDTGLIPSRYGTVVGNVCRHSLGASAPGNGIRVEDSQYVSVVGNTIDDIQNGNGIVVNSAVAGITTKFITVEGNTLSNCLINGIKVAPESTGGTFTNVVVSGNLLDTCGQAGGSDVRAGIQIGGATNAASGILVIGNYLTNCGKGDGNGGGIVLYKSGASGSTVLSNYVSSTPAGTLGGIAAWNGDAGQTYTNVHIADNQMVSNSTDYNSECTTQAGITLVFWSATSGTTFSKGFTAKANLVLDGSQVTAGQNWILMGPISNLTSGNFLQGQTTTSAFAGVGILFNFANGSGTFTGKFADFQVNGASKFNVRSTGGFVTTADFQRSRQTPTEAVLVSGVDATAGEIVSVTLTAARVVGAPLNPATGQNLTFELTQGGVGAFAVTWNAVFKKTWADTGNATGKISSITFYYNGTNWVQTGAQAPYV